MVHGVPRAGLTAKEETVHDLSPLFSLSNSNCVMTQVEECPSPTASGGDSKPVQKLGYALKLLQSLNSGAKCESSLLSQKVDVVLGQHRPDGDGARSSTMTVGLHVPRESDGDHDGTV